MTREEILSIGEYYAEHKISYKKRQEEFWRPFRNFYKAKQKYWRADEQDTQSDEIVSSIAYADFISVARTALESQYVRRM